MDRNKLLKEEKDELSAFCDKLNLDTTDCFAKIDFVNLLLEKKYKYSDFKNRNAPKVAFKGVNNPVKTTNPQKKHFKRTATRFCVDAHIDENDQLDLAEFILAARYIGTQANDDQLMDVFMNQIDNDQSNLAKPKEQIKDLLKKVDDKYSDQYTNNNVSDNNNDDDDNGAITKLNTSVYSTPNNNFDDIYTVDAAYQEKDIDDFIISTQKDQNLEIAKQLLATTALTRHEIAEITGCDPNKLKEYESDEYDTDDDDDYDSDDDDNDNDDDNKNDDKATVQQINTPAGGVQIVGNGKSVMISSDQVSNLKTIVDGGNDIIIKESENIIKLLKKMQNAINLAPGHMKRAKTMAKLANLNISNINPKKDDPIKFPIKYRVIIEPGALCKKTIELKSKQVAKLRTGTQVIVEEISGNRVRISSPANGWLSIKSSKSNKIIIQKSNMNTPEMANAIKAERSRNTKILMLKSITALHDKTVIRILEKSKWNLRVAIDSYYVAKFKTAEFGKKNSTNNTSDDKNKNKNKKGWWKAWKTYSNQ